MRDASAAIATFVGRPVPVLYPRQEHTRLVCTFGVDRPLEAGPHLVGTCDAIVTAEREVALAVQTADCLPVALVAGDVIAIVHAGWRGLAADILGATLRRIELEFGLPARAADAVVGVGVGPCHYPVGPEVAAALGVLAVNGKPWQRGDRVDLGVWARGRLEALGVPAANVRALEGCTACSPRHHSYRRDGVAAARQWSAVILADEAPDGARRTAKASVAVS